MGALWASVKKNANDYGDRVAWCAKNLLISLTILILVAMSGLAPIMILVAVIGIGLGFYWSFASYWSFSRYKEALGIFESEILKNKLPELMTCANFREGFKI